MLSEFGCDYIELTNPAASPQSRDDCEAICKLGLKAKILTHTRCTLEDAKLACDCGVDGVDVVIGTSQFLREHSLGGKDMISITKQAIEVIEYIKSRGCEVRFSSEDSFRTIIFATLSQNAPMTYKASTLPIPAKQSNSIRRALLHPRLDSSGSGSAGFLRGRLTLSNNVGVGRVGVADTVGCASPRQVYDLVRTLRGCVSTDIEVHFHDDTGCAVANSFTALEAGATRIQLWSDFTKRKMARMMPTSRDYILSKYKLHQLKAIEDYVAEAVEINVPFNNPITGFCAFTHKAGIHAKAILNSPSTYEILKPEDFGLSSVHFTSRLTGWNAIKSRVDQLGLDANSWPEDKIRQVTAKIKQMADLKVMTLDETDALIRSFHLDLQKGHGQNGQNDESVEKAT
ncbi:hypothetical protein O1611_g769 [Lasiodiplodia mahajangana]|uniref:Uncharacterized protein n=1 Tax=Lasiodiplodia mahajangana TaxID=1108764 RepID=A0ACC2JZU9_9PEZI|nr:hypothetical protein O1611_g769 [Lasiodiplodia mahajangana]